MEIEDIIKIQKAELESTKDLLAKIIFEKDSGLTVIGLMFRNNSEKTFMRRAVLNALRNQNIEKYWFASTAWYLTENVNEKGKQLYRQPSRDVNRKECLIIIEFRKDKNNKMFFFDIQRKNDTITFSEEKSSTKIMDSYWDLWESEHQLDIKNDEYVTGVNKAFITNSLKEIMKDKINLINDETSEEDIAKMAMETMKEFMEKVKEQDKTLLEDVDKFDDDNA